MAATRIGIVTRTAEENNDGKTATESWHVPNASPVVALDDPGLPKLRDPHPSDSRMVVSKLQSEGINPENNTASIVKVTYSSGASTTSGAGTILRPDEIQEDVPNAGTNPKDNESLRIDIRTRSVTRPGAYRFVRESFPGNTSKAENDNVTLTVAAALDKDIEPGMVVYISDGVAKGAQATIATISADLKVLTMAFPGFEVEKLDGGGNINDISVNLGNGDAFVINPEGTPIGSGGSGWPVLIPEEHIAWTKWLDAFPGSDFLGVTGKINSKNWKGRSKGTVLFLGVQARQQSKRLWEVTFNFVTAPEGHQAKYFLKNGRNKITSNTEIESLIYETANFDGFPL